MRLPSGWRRAILLATVITAPANSVAVGSDIAITPGIGLGVLRKALFFVSFTALHAI